jgi:glycosyltransferase involved in cell wall biosynthesis
MKVYFVGSGLQGCYNVRCLFPLQANGWDGDRTSFSLDSKTPENKSKAAIQADIVVFHRPIKKELLELARILKKNGKKIVMDNDDTLKEDNGFKFNDYMNEQRVKNGIEKISSALDEFIKEADLITCSTEFLKKEYENINSNVIVLPNYIDPFYFPEPIKNDSEIIRIGITGSVGVTNDIEPLKPIINHYQNDPRVRLVLLSLPVQGQNEIYKKLYSEEYSYWSSVNIEWHPFAKVNEYYEYLNGLKLDMVIIPRYDSLFNRCKSNLKFLENSMLEIPTIAQSFSTKDSPYEQNPEDSKHLLLAENTEEFINQIEFLIADKDRRIKIGKDAKKYVEENYDINDEKNSVKWINAYKTIL